MPRYTDQSTPARSQASATPAASMSTAPNPASRMGRHASSAERSPSVVIRLPSACREGSGWER